MSELPDATTYSVTAAVAVAALHDFTRLTERQIRTWRESGALAVVGHGPRGVNLYDLAAIVVLARKAARAQAGTDDWRAVGA